MKIDTGIGSNLASIAARAGQAEAAGLDCLWASETTNDPFLSLALAAEHSERVALGTAITIAFSRNPMSLAYTTNQLQEFSGGRIILGLGSQVRAHIERRFSSEWSRPAARMREFVLALRAIWASFNDGAPLDFQGDFYTHTLMTPLFLPRPHQFGAPLVFLAAVGPGMTEVAGEVADGVITHGLSSSRYVREVTVYENDEQEAKARAAMRRQVAFYSSTPAYRPVLDVHGWGDLQPELYACSKRGAWGDMAGLVNDEMVDTFTIIATPDTLAAEVGARYGGVADRITASWWRKDWWPPVGAALSAL
jgi:alkanesulfonate monooxygenase SsuD/methylene tetrahydromethanopterin reductase-like flavin-dependent oxidoreductase (luciferase family)